MLFMEKSNSIELGVASRGAASGWLSQRGVGLRVAMLAHRNRRHGVASASVSSRSSVTVVSAWLSFLPTRSTT